jgi:hypothetical protein
MVNASFEHCNSLGNPVNGVQVKTAWCRLWSISTKEPSKSNIKFFLLPYLLPLHRISGGRGAVKNALEVEKSTLAEICLIHISCDPYMNHTPFLLTHPQPGLPSAQTFLTCHFVHRHYRQLCSHSRISYDRTGSIQMFALGDFPGRRNCH